MKENYSVLMSVYYKEKPEYLRESIESMLNQSVKPDDLVLVCDGPLNEPLDEVIASFTEAYKELTVVRLPENKGLGNALNEGMKYTRNELIARMDSDDISRPDRCEKELTIFQNNPDIDIVSGTIEEFDEAISKINSRRELPETNDEILEFAKKRNPFNHPAVMFRKSAVEAVGGYEDFYLLEDYYLWIRMLLNGSKGYNIKDPLLYMRAGSDMYRRRSGSRYAKSQKRLFKLMLTKGFISGKEYMAAVWARTATSLVPNDIREKLYKRILRK